MADRITARCCIAGGGPPGMILTVAVDRLERWHRPGLLCIGDAAHAMSPVGGVGFNLAVQDGGVDGVNDLG